MKPEGAKRHQANRRHGAAAVGQAFAELDDLDGIAALDRNKLVAEDDGSVIQEGIDFQDILAFCFADIRAIIPHRGNAPATSLSPWQAEWPTTRCRSIGSFRGALFAGGGKIVLEIDCFERRAMAEHNEAEIILYQSQGANVPVRVSYMNETFWMPQKEIAELFGKDKSTISRHLKNIFESGELDENSVVAEIATTAADGKNYRVLFYNLDAIIAVGYRVNSMQATRFRQWATSTLKEYIVKGFVLNDDMLKNGAPFGKDYFDELLVRIRDIRASERRVYQKITDIFQECTFDYDRNSDIARRFYATVQNKLHYAVTGDTAAGIVQRRSDPALPHMGLTSWKGSPDGPIHSSDVTVAKNYLTEKEISDLNRLVTMFLDAAEMRAERQQLTSMEECVALLDGFLTFNGREVLKGLGDRNKKTADKIAHERFDEYRKLQDATYENDFEKAVKKLKD
ncbi:RhuM family protein [Slackia isoflavoniconvertens]|uniref:RhuM family protein n=1 Tax=Slackia isoflavoniconvertens TaxID=572010 RepID=UPI002E784FBD|nr:RhuM family protein [Slackia isoflavoniconvertens]